MSFKHKIRALLLGAVFLMGAGIGVPMRPDQIEASMHSMSPVGVEMAVEIEKTE